MTPTVLERGGEYFRELWKSLTESDRNLLQRLVHGETPAAQDKAVLRKLERKEILEKTESGYHFQVVLVQNYVEQVVEEEELTIFVTEYKEEKQRTFNFHDSFFFHHPNRCEHQYENLDVARFPNCLSN